MFAFQHVLLAILTLVISEVLIVAQQPTPSIEITVIGPADVSQAKVALILKSGAYQKVELKDGVFTCLLTERPAKVWAGCEGFEAYSGTVAGAESITIALKPSETKNSTLIFRRGPLPGIDGEVDPILDKRDRTYAYSHKIALLSNGQPATQPMKFKVKSPIEAEDPTGKKFQIWIEEITQQVSLVEYTKPGTILLETTPNKPATAGSKPATADSKPATAGSKPGAPTPARDDSAAIPTSALIVEALIDGPSELHVRADSIYWINGAYDKPGRYRKANEPTYIDGASWYPVWKKNNESSGMDKSNTHKLSAPLDPAHVMFRLIAVTLMHGGVGIEKRDKIQLNLKGDELAILIPDSAPGARWYKFALIPNAK